MRCLTRRRPRRLAVRIALPCAALVVLALSAPAGASAATAPGVQTHLLWTGVSSQDVIRQLDAAKAAGAKWVRADLSWSSLQQDSKSEYESWYLARIDRLVSEADRRGIKVLPTVTSTPCWASSAPADIKQGCTGSWWTRNVHKYAPSDPQDYADALAFLVGRYGDRVPAWEVWNEPNATHFLRAPDNATAYAQILKAAYPKAKRAYPGATIVAGALSASDYRFTESLLQKGIAGSFDAFSIHPYSGGDSPLAPMQDQYMKNSFIRGVPAVRDALVRYGVRKPIWLTEFGWSTWSGRDVPPWARGVSEAVQADYMGKALAQAAKWSYVPVAIGYELTDVGTDRDDRLSNYGLLRHDGSQKPAYAAFERAAAAVAAGTTTSESTGPKPGGTRQGGLTLRLIKSRADRRIWATGRATCGRVVGLRVYSWSRGRRRFVHRGAFATPARGVEGSYRRPVISRLVRRRWKVVAACAGTRARREVTVAL